MDNFFIAANNTSVDSIMFKSIVWPFWFLFFNDSALLNNFFGHGNPIAIPAAIPAAIQAAIPTVIPAGIRTVKTNSGVIRGRLHETILKHHEYYGYKGIPFATPPVNELRFKAPEPIKPWTGTLDAFEYPPACPQHHSWEVANSNTSEDCLFLNVFVPGK